VDATHKPHGYLLFDFTNDRNDGLRFRTNIFPTDTHPLAFYSDIGDEAREIKLSYFPSAKDGRNKIA